MIKFKKSVPSEGLTIDGLFDMMKIFKLGIFTRETFKKNWGILPLPIIQLSAAAWMIFAAYQRLFVTTIDVQIFRHRFEMPSKPKFIDLRSPRRLKLWGVTPDPMFDLDNRYRLMRGEQPLSPEGCPMEKFTEYDNMTFEEFNKYYVQNI